MEKKRIGTIGLGRLYDLSEVPDEMFANEKLGKGYALELSSGRIIAPISGRVFSLFPTSHAFGILSDDLEVLVHLGIDTVSLNGKGFFPHVDQGDYVEKGDLIVTVDLAYIQSQNCSLISPVVITSKQDVKLVENKTFIEDYESDILEII